jgi:Ca2+-binding RTX toxin-like protein
LSANYGDTLNPYASKTANYVLAAPNGVAGVPTFRAVVAADIPTLNQNTTGTAAGLSATLAIASGGTGQTTASAAFNALSPITTTGDLILGNGTNSATRLAIGANGYLLSSNGTTASWQPAPAGGVTTFAGGTTGLTPASATTGAISLAGTLVVSNGGTGATTLTGYVKGTGTSALTASSTIPNTDISGLGTMSTQNANSVAETGGAIDGTGNSLNNTITGNTLNNTLNGGLGDDILDGGGGLDTFTGLGGADTFYFSTKGTLSVGSASHITDFNRSEGDLIKISRSAFGIPSGATVSIATITSSTQLDGALGTANTFVYDSISGNLYWNQNGDSAGAGSGGVLAVLDNHADLNNNSISLA